MQNRDKLYINGQWVASAGGKTIEVIAPFGGHKQSGQGRELGRAGLEEYLEYKSLQLRPETKA